MAALGPAISVLIGAGCSPSSDSQPQPSRSATPPKENGLRELAALGYADWDPIEESAEESRQPRSGVVRAELDLSAPVRRVWTDDVSTVLSCRPDGSDVRRTRVPGHRQVELARPLDGGRVVALSVDEGVTLLDPDGEVLWQVSLPCHHEVTVAPRAGDTVGTRLLAVALHGEKSFRGRRVRFDSVTFLEEATGRPTEDPAWREWSTWSQRTELEALFADRPHPLATRPSNKGDASEGTVYDYFHLNGIAFDGPATMYLCLRNVSLVARVELPTGDVSGEVGHGLLDWPHAPSIVQDEDGEKQLLLFDNGAHRGWSRAVLIDLASGRVAWEWSGSPPRSLWSRVRGSAEMLSNGNVLLTESERGRILEVTRQGNVAWEFLNPDVVESKDGLRRRRIYRAHASASW
ncbi:MAG: arylsulfotransferase family protein [Planctomycetota bacterium]